VFSQNNFRYWLIALLIPALAWVFLNKIWVGRFFLGADNTDCFYWFIYYFKNILHGVYPLWNPFKSWGSLDYIDTQYIGICNPVSMIIPILLFLGMKAYWTYASYMVVLWLIGFVGFYFLLHRLYKDPRIAWAGTSLLMFSGGLAVFFSWDILGLYIFAPLGWFFGFLIGFARPLDDHSLKRNMFGLCFSSMFIAHLYIPFYFLTLFFTFIISVLIFASDWIVQFLQAIKKALIRMPLAFFLCLLSVLCALWPTVDCYFKMRDPQNITQFFRGSNENNAGNSIGVSQEMIDIGGLPSRATISEFFSSYETGDHYLSFVPMILYILALLTLFNRSSKTQRVVFMTGFLLMLIALTNACPLQHFLYEHLYFFRIFRNYFFFWILFWSCCVVYVMGETKRFLDWDLAFPKQKGWYAVWVITVHAAAMIYLISLEDVPLVSYATITASCGWFLTRLFDKVRLRQDLFIIGLVFIGLWQPFYVLPLIRGVDHSKEDYVRQEGAFSYERPLFGSGYNEKNPLGQRQKYFQDESGFVESGYMGQRASYLLTQNLNRETLADYVRHKFILYDRTSFMQENNIDWDRVRKVITFEDPRALIEDKSGIVSLQVGDPLAPIIVKKSDPYIKVVSFNVNSISLRVHLDGRKFLVYNDSFHSGWHVEIDQSPAQLYQANIAFKGVWVNKGDHLVRFYFGSWVDYLRGWGVPLLFMCWFVLMITICFERAL